MSTMEKWKKENAEIDYTCSQFGDKEYDKMTQMTPNELGMLESEVRTKLAKIVYIRLLRTNKGAPESALIEAAEWNNYSPLYAWRENKRE